MLIIWFCLFVQETLKPDTSLQRNVDNSQWKGTVALKKEDGEFFPGTRVSPLLTNNSVVSLVYTMTHYVTADFTENVCVCVWGGGGGLCACPGI